MTQSSSSYAYVVTHGLFPRYLEEDVRILDEASASYVADGACQWPLLEGRTLDYWAGDGDSTPAGNKPHHILGIEKNLSDGEAVLRKALNDGHRRVFWYGALGGRRDFEWAHLDLLRTLAKEFESSQIVMFHDYGQVLYLQNSLWQWKNCKGASLSMWGTLEDRKTLVETQGLRYNLKNHGLICSTHGMSNVLEASHTEIQVHHGGLFIYTSVRRGPPIRSFQPNQSTRSKS